MATILNPEIQQAANYFFNTLIPRHGRKYAITVLRRAMHTFQLTKQQRNSAIGAMRAGMDIAPFVFLYNQGMIYNGRICSRQRYFPTFSSYRKYPIC